GNDSAVLSLDSLKSWITTDHAVAAYFAPRGIGLSAWNPAERAQTHIRRRFMLLGQTVDSMRVWDIRRAIQALNNISYTNPKISLQAEGAMAVNALYASLFEPVTDLKLWNLPPSQMQGPDYLNVLRVLDIPQAVFLALKDRPIRLRGANKKDWLPLLEFTKRSPRTTADGNPWFAIE